MSAFYEQAAQRVREALGVTELPERGTREYLEFLADLEHSHPSYARLLSDAELTEDEELLEEPPEKPAFATRLRVLTDSLKRRAIWRESVGGAWVLNKSRGFLVLGVLGVAAFGTYAGWYYTRPVQGSGALLSSQANNRGAQTAPPVEAPFTAQPERFTADATLPESQTGAITETTSTVPPAPRGAPSAAPSSQPLVDAPPPPPVFTQPPANTYTSPTLSTPTPLPSAPQAAPVRLPTPSEPPAAPFPTPRPAPRASQPRTVGVQSPPTLQNQATPFGADDTTAIGAEEVTSPVALYTRPGSSAASAANATSGASTTGDASTPVWYANTPAAGQGESAQQNASPILYTRSDTTAATNSPQGTAAQNTTGVSYLRPNEGREAQASSPLFYTKNSAQTTPPSAASTLPASLEAAQAAQQVQQSVPSAAPGTTTSTNTPPAVQVGQIVTARLVTAVETFEGRTVPVIAESSEGNWVGVASINPAFGRMELQFTRLVKDGQPLDVNGLAYDTGYTQGLLAATRDVSPALAQDLVRAGVSSLNTYAQSLLSGGTTTITGGIGVTTKNAAPLSAIVAGELGKVFQLPQNNQSFLRVARVERGTQFLIALGLNEERRR